MRLALALILLIAAAILIFSATIFDLATVLAIAAAMLLVSFFAGAAVLLGVITRRADHRRPSPTRQTPPNTQAHDERVPE